MRGAFAPPWPPITPARPPSRRPRARSARRVPGPPPERNPRIRGAVARSHDVLRVPGAREGGGPRRRRRRRGGGGAGAREGTKGGDGRRLRVRRIVRRGVEEPLRVHFPHLRHGELAGEYRRGGAGLGRLPRGPHMGGRQVGGQV